MPTSSLNRSAAALGVAVALLAGCGGSQPPVAAPGAMPHTPAIATHAERGGSWMLPEAKSGDRSSAVILSRSSLTVSPSKERFFFKTSWTPYP